MALGIPKKKIEEFEKEVLNAKNREELIKIKKKIETAYKLHLNEELGNLLAYVYYNLGDFDNALKVLEGLRNIFAKYLEANIRIAKRDFYTAYNILKNIYPFTKGDLKMEILTMELLILSNVYNYEKIKEILEKEDIEKVENYIYENETKVSELIFEKLEEYIEANNKLKENKDLKTAYKRLEKALKSMCNKDFKIVPMLEIDEETGDKSFVFYVISNEPCRDKEEEIIKKVYLKEPKLKEIFFIDFKKVKEEEMKLVLS